MLYFKYVSLNKSHCRKPGFFDCVLKIFSQEQPKKRVSFAICIDEELHLDNQDLLFIQCNEDLKKCNENDIKEDVCSSISEQITGVIVDLDLCSNSEDTRLFRCLNLSMKDVLYSLKKDIVGLPVKDYLDLRERLLELEAKLTDSEFILNHDDKCLKDILLIQIIVSKLEMDLKVYMESKEEKVFNRLIATITDAEKQLNGTKFLNIFITYKNQLSSKEYLEKIYNDLSYFERLPLLEGYSDRAEDTKEIISNVITGFENIINRLFVGDFS